MTSGPLDAIRLDVKAGALDVTVGDRFAQALQLAAKDAVNAAALVITHDARRRVQAAIGPEQRLSGVTTQRRKGGKVSKVSMATLEAGGAKINPYYREADSTTKPVALIGARGVAHLIEHRRRGGYTVKSTRKAAFTGSVPLLDLFAGAGVSGRQMRQAIAETARRPAIMTPQGPRAVVHPGPIRRPLRPITKAFLAAPRLVDRAAREALDKSLRQTQRRG